MGVHHLKGEMNDLAKKLSGRGSHRGGRASRTCFSGRHDLSPSLAENFTFHDIRPSIRN